MTSTPHSVSERKQEQYTIERLEPGLSRLFLSCMLVLFSGYIDSIGYLQMGKVYLSFMSGNSTKLGIALFQGEYATIIHIGLVILLFVTGAFLGTLITDQFVKNKVAVILGVEVLLFISAIILELLHQQQEVLFPIAIAMGMQNTLHQMVSHVDVGKGFVSGVLFGVGQALAKCLRRKAAAAESFILALSWFAFVIGAALGAWSLFYTSLLAVLIISVFFLIVLIPYVLYMQRQLT
ncbi:YoaK family protein [Paenibacillus campi]|uniref:YoaK family protein n=1 Tax=Paenibacillus campi TaxID=3106031 RepID=UPI002AFFFF69|nr:YoaK family protein [Paenibacillus sp. SGZ-1009]